MLKVKNIIENVQDGIEVPSDITGKGEHGGEKNYPKQTPSPNVPPTKTREGGENYPGRKDGSW